MVNFLLLPFFSNTTPKQQFHCPDSQKTKFLWTSVPGDLTNSKNDWCRHQYLNFLTVGTVVLDADDSGTKVGSELSQIDAKNKEHLSACTIRALYDYL